MTQKQKSNFQSYAFDSSIPTLDAQSAQSALKPHPTFDPKHFNTKARQSLPIIKICLKNPRPIKPSHQRYPPQSNNQITPLRQSEPAPQNSTHIQHQFLLPTHLIPLHQVALQNRTETLIDISLHKINLVLQTLHLQRINIFCHLCFIIILNLI